VNPRQRLHVASVALAIAVACGCVVERPVANEADARGRGADLFALDCRAWPQDDPALQRAGDPLAVEVRASLVDFGESDTGYTLSWSVDGADVEVATGSRPTVTGSPVQYRHVFSFRHVFGQPGLHTIGATVSNGQRKASCSSTVRLGKAAERSR
jgi:hypothetical protein